MKSTSLKNILQIVADLLKIGKTTAKDLQISGDIDTANRIRKAIEKNDIKKLRRIATRGGIMITDSDILGIWQPKKPGDPYGILVTPEYIVNNRQLVKVVRRYQRKGV